MLKTDIGDVEVGLSGFTLDFEVVNGTIDDDSFPSAIDRVLPERAELKRQAVVAREAQSWANIGARLSGRAGPNTLALSGAVKGAWTEQEKTVSSRSEATIVETRAVKVTGVRSNGFAVGVENTFQVGEAINQKVYDDRICYIRPTQPTAVVKISQCVEMRPQQLIVGAGTGVFGKESSGAKKKLVTLLIAELVGKRWDLNSVEITDER